MKYIIHRVEEGWILKIYNQQNRGVYVARFRKAHEALDVVSWVMPVKEEHKNWMVP